MGIVEPTHQKIYIALEGKGRRRSLPDRSTAGNGLALIRLFWPARHLSRNSFIAAPLIPTEYGAREGRSGQRSARTDPKKKLAQTRPPCVCVRFVAKLTGVPRNLNPAASVRVELFDEQNRFNRRTPGYARSRPSRLRNVTIRQKRRLPGSMPTSTFRLFSVSHPNMCRDIDSRISVRPGDHPGDSGGLYFRPPSPGAGLPWEPAKSTSYRADRRAGLNWPWYSRQSRQPTISRIGLDRQGTPSC